MAGEGYAQAVSDRGFVDADNRHLRAARPPRARGHERLRGADDEVRDRADDERRDDRRHADREEDRDDRELNGG